MLPSEAAPGQRVRLPGQTKVTTEEYKGFLGLGHGDIFDLDPDLCASARNTPHATPSMFEAARSSHDLAFHVIG